jgi:NAD(P)-dependent dehydrogenase (short-subunit alcohol dehydrogenase family)
MDLGLEDKVALITGGSDGLGLALAERLLAEGASVALCGRSEERLAEASARLGDPARVLVQRCDVARADEIDAFVEAALGRFGRLDAVVSNAGAAAAVPVVDSTDVEWEADLESKVLAGVRLARRCAEPLADSGHGALLSVLAMAAKAPGAGSTPSSASRAAGLAVTKALSKELGPRGIRANAVLVGLVESGQWRRRAEASGIAMGDFYEAMAAEHPIPLGRVGRAEEFADLAAFLLSPRAGYVSGAAINLDGGLSPVW